MIAQMIKLLIDLFLGAWCISSAVVYFQLQKYFRFSLLLLISIGYACFIIKYVFIGG